MSVIKKTRADRVFDVFNLCFLSLVVFIMVYPIYFTIIASVSDPYAVVNGQVILWPKQITWEGYGHVFKNASIWRGYLNTIFYTVGGTAFNLILTIPAAYVLSKQYLFGRKGLTWYFLITMYFGGGLIPTFMTVKSIGLLNKAITLVFLNGLSVYNLVVTRVFFQSTIPNELYESARIDGAGEFRMFFQLALPLSSAIIAVMSLYYAVARWNDFFTALIYVSDAKLQPLQFVLRNILIEGQNALASVDTMGADEDTLRNAARLAYLAESMKYCVIFVSSAPLLIAYPFVQKYFVKGVMIGSLKG